MPQKTKLYQHTGSQGEGGEGEEEEEEEEEEEAPQETKCGNSRNKIRTPYLLRFIFGEMEKNTCLMVFYDFYEKENKNLPCQGA